MTAFAPKRSFRVADPYEMIGAALDRPFSLSRNLAEQFQQGLLDSFGLGTVVRDLSIPQGNVPRIGVSPVPLFGSIYEGVKGAVELTRPEQPSLTEDEYKSSPHFREEIPWEPGMTEDRAAALAGFWDIKHVRQHFAEKRPISSFIGQLGGQMFDPINYIPMTGPVMQAAAVARAGSIVGRALVSAGDAALNTAMFGVITRDIRSKFGDDVSWQAIGIEIAMSALIGGAFGGGVGVFMRGRDARERAALVQARQKLDTARNQQAAVIALNESIDTLATDGEVRLSPNATERIQPVIERMAEPPPSRQLAEASQTVTGTKAGEVVISPSGARVAVRPEVVELDSLQRATGALQVRDRSTASSAAQVEDIAINLDPARLMPNVDGSQGAPMVGPDNVIDSGNGRVMALRRAYEAYPDKAATYRQALEEAGYSTEGVVNPVLIQRRVTDLSPEARAKFNAEVNSPTTARMSAVEIANMDRDAIMSGSVLDVLTDGPVTSAANRPFVDRFLNQIPQNERGALVDSTGTSLSADGARRVENALVSAAFGDIDAGVIRRFAEATDDNTRAIIGAMSDVAGKWAQMRRGMQRGEIGPEFDPTTELTHALRLMSQWRDQAAREKRAVSVVIREGMNQIDMLSGELSIETKFLIRAMFNNDHFAVAVGRDKLAARLGNIVDQAFILGQPSMFGDELAVTKAEMLQNALAKDVETDLFAAPDVPERAPQGDGGPAGAEARGRDRPDLGAGAPRSVGGAQGVLTTMRQRLVDAGRPADEAEANAVMIAEFYRGMASMTGRSVDDLADQYGLPDVRRGDVVPEGALAQGATTEDAGAFADQLKAELGLRSLDLHVTSEGDLKLNMIAVPRDKLGQGIGTEAMSRITDFADARGMRVTLTTGVKDPNFGTTSMSRLKDFYKRFGFVENKGRNKDFTTRDNMIRNPRRPLNQAPRPWQEGEMFGGFETERGLEGLPQTLVPGVKPMTDAERMAAAAAKPLKKGEAPPAKGSLFDVEGREDAAAQMTLFQPAYHGTPHIFDRFSSDKIGTGGAGPRGAIQFDGSRSIISIFETADASTVLHETGHHFLTMFKSLAEQPDAPAGIRADWDQVKEWWNSNADAVANDSPAEVTGADVRAVLETGTSGDRVKDLAINVGLQEQWARAFEAYAREGRAPTLGLRRVFEEFKRWLTAIYRRAADLNVDLSNQIKDVFDRMLGGPLGENMTVVDFAPPRAAGAERAAPRLDTSPPSPDPIPAALAPAAARVGKPEAMRELAEMHGVKEDGSYIEQGDIDQIREEGALTPEDEAALKAADTEVEVAEAWGRALEAAMVCVTPG